MTDRAVLYDVSVRPRGRRSGPVPLGDLDGSGTSLVTALAGMLEGFTELSEDGTRVARALLVEPAAGELFAIVQHGQRGIAADIVGAKGEVRLRQRPDDLQLLRCAWLFRLPPASTAGELAVHVSNGRGVKELVERGIVERFRSAFPGLTLSLERRAEPEALRAAVAAGEVEAIRLVRREAAGENALAGIGKWAGPETGVRVQVEVAARPPGARLEQALLARYLDGDEGVFAQIVELGGWTFTDAFVAARLPDGTRRLFDLARPASGPPASRELPALELDADGEPTAASLRAALQAALES